MSMLLRGNLTDFFTEDKLPELESIITAKAEGYQSMIPLLFNQIRMTTDIYQTTTLSGLRNPEDKPEGQPVSFQSIKPGYSKTFTATTLAAGFAISKEAVDDGKENFIQRAVTSFGKGAFEVKEYRAADVFNNGFTTNGYDGVPLFSNSHPIENGMGVLGDNLGEAATLNLTAFQDLRNILQSTINEDGQKLHYKAKFLVVPQLLQDKAKKLLLSAYEPDNANNGVNTMHGHCSLLPGDCWQYLSSDTAFFLVCDPSENGLMYLQREAFNVDSDYNKKARAFESMSFERYTQGYAGWRGVAGNAGA